MTLYILQLVMEFQSILQDDCPDLMYSEQCYRLGFPTCLARIALVSQNAWVANDVVGIPGLFWM